jgi:hypothetical protein
MKGHLNRNRGFGQLRIEPKRLGFDWKLVIFTRTQKELLVMDINPKHIRELRDELSRLLDEHSFTAE